MQYNGSPESSKRIKDMDTRPAPIHIDDFEITDPNEKWIPGNKRPVRPQKASDNVKTEEQKLATQKTVAKSIDQFHTLIILLIAVAILGAVVFLAIWVGDVYGLDLIGQFKELIASVL